MNHWDYAAALGFAALVSAGTAFQVWQRQSYVGSRPLAISMLALTFWSLTYALYWLPIPPEGYFWLDLTYLGVVVVPPGILLFTLQFTQQTHTLSKRLTSLLFAIPLLTTVILWTDPWHGLFFGHRPAGLGTILSGGFWFYINIAYSYSLVLFCFALITRSYLRSRGLYRQQQGAMLIGISIPLLSNIISLAGGSPFPNLDLTPLMFTVTGLVITYALFRLGLLDIVPVARDRVVEQMADGVIVLDDRDRIVDLNPAAKQLLTMHGDKIIGTQAQKRLMRWPELAKALSNPTAQQTARIEGKRGQTLDLTVSPLYDRGNTYNGRLLIVRDISERIRVEKALRQVNLSLRTKIEEIEQLQHQLREQAIRDALTGVFNRRYLEESLGRELARVKRTGEPLSVAMLDIDHFKQFNDAHGHAAGDRMLQSLAAILQGNTRAGDIVCRYGGEEFAVVLPGASAEIARARMEFCRKAFEREALDYDGQELRSTLSAGIATFPTDGDQVNLILDRADKALYVAKEKGRNQVSSYSELLIQ